VNRTFLEALAAYLESQASVLDLFPGGIYNTTAAPGAEIPYLTLKLADSQATGIVGRPIWIDKLTINFEVRETTGDAATLLVDQLRTAIMSPPISLLSWATGRECGRFLMPSAAGELEDGLGVDGSDVWVERLPIGFTITRSA
jgi:hypothetical protein